MNDYPERLMLVRDEKAKEQDHYLLVVDEEGNEGSTGKIKWYPIKNGWLKVSIPKLSLRRVFSQRETYVDEEWGGVEREKTEFLTGTGELIRGTPNSHGIGISHFGSNMIHKNITVRIEQTREEKEHIYFWGTKDEIEPGFRLYEEFDLNLRLNERRYAELLEHFSQGSMQECEITFSLGGLSGFYSEWTFYEGNSFGHIKYFDYKNRKHILNKEEFEDDYIKETFEDLEAVGMSYLFELSLAEQFDKPTNQDSNVNNDDSDEDETTDFEGDDQPSIEERTFFLRTKELTVETSKLNIQTYIFRSIMFFGICLLVTLWFR